MNERNTYVIHNIAKNYEFMLNSHHKGGGLDTRRQHDLIEEDGRMVTTFPDLFCETRPCISICFGHLIRFGDGHRLPRRTRELDGWQVHLEDGASQIAGQIVGGTVNIACNKGIYRATLVPPSNM